MINAIQENKCYETQKTGEVRNNGHIHEHNT